MGALQAASRDGPKIWATISTMAASGSSRCIASTKLGSLTPRSLGASTGIRRRRAREAQVANSGGTVGSAAVLMLQAARRPDPARARASRSGGGGSRAVSTIAEISMSSRAAAVFKLAASSVMLLASCGSTKRRSLRARLLPSGTMADPDALHLCGNRGGGLSGRGELGVAHGSHRLDAAHRAGQERLSGRDHPVDGQRFLA